MANKRAHRSIKPLSIALGLVGSIFAWNASRALLGTIATRPSTREVSSSVSSQTAKTNYDVQRSTLRVEIPTKTQEDNVTVETANAAAPMMVLPEPYACLDKLPAWCKDTSAKGLQRAIVDGSGGLTDKTARGHKYQHMYHRYVSEIVRRKCHNNDDNSQNKNSRT